MRLLVVIPHYFGARDPANNSPVIGAYIEPLSRIAALSETIASLTRHFGPCRTTHDGGEVPSAERGNVLDVVIVAMRGHNVLAELGLDPAAYSVEYVDGPPAQIPYFVQPVMKARLGRYDFYCLIEDDLAIHDPDFFAKLAWFQQSFGPRALLAPTRVETAYTGTPAKIIVDPPLPEHLRAPFRRPGQRAELSAVWHGDEWHFGLPANPHAASFFLTQEQLAYWVAQPHFDDRDASWVGPVESAVSLGIGKTFDIYKAVSPDPFFLEIHHYGTALAGRGAPSGRRYGEPPLLAIAQGAVRAAAGATAPTADNHLSTAAVQSWIAAGSAGEAVADLMRTAATARRLTGENRALADEVAVLQAKLASADRDVQPQPRSLRALLRSFGAEVMRRVKG